MAIITQFLLSKHSQVSDLPDVVIIVFQFSDTTVLLQIQWRRSNPLLL
ncbi:hypothetical protein [Candidatus Nitrosocosmicus sp. T]